MHTHSQLNNHSRSTHTKTRRALALLMCLLVVNLPLTQAYALDRNALPTGGQVTAGSAIIQQSGSQMTVQQGSQQAIIDWQHFNIGADAGVTFKQPNSSAVALNRVIGGDPSQIFGKLNANGQLFLVNAAGILFAPGSQVDVGGLTASTMNITNDDFLAGRMIFHRDGSTAGVVNQGTITAADNGHIALLGATVRNEGVISTRFGQVILAAGETVTMNAGVGGYLQVAVDPATVSTLVENKELIQADGGQVLMTARAAGELLSAVVSNTGTVQARTLENRDGRIMLLGDMDQGQAMVGGTLDASAPDGGNGGFIETSAAKVTIADSAKITTLAPHGTTGTWLIDPADYTIAASGGDITGAALSANLGSTNVTILSDNGLVNTNGNGDIFVNDTITWSGNKLTLSAQNNININATMNGSGTASLALEYGQGALAAGNTSDYIIKNSATVNLPSGNSFSTKLGSDGAVHIYTVINDVTALQNMSANLGGYYALGSNIDASATSGWNSGAGFLPVGNSSTKFTGTFEGLNHTIGGLTIIRPATSNVGLFGSTSGTTLRNVGLTGVNITGNMFVGSLVGDNSGNISNTYSTGAVNGANIYIGGLVGVNESGGSITNSFSTGPVTGQDYIGGLVGDNYGSITNSYSMGAVNGRSQAGGLVGCNESGGSIANSYSTGAASVTEWSVGGLVGWNSGSIVNSYSTGAVSGLGNVGGLVGVNDNDFSGSSITNSYSTGAVTGDPKNKNTVGGLVGINEHTGSITKSYWDTSINPSLPGVGDGSIDDVTGLTTAQLQQSSNYTGWDFANTWYMVDGYTRPFLRSEYSTTINNAHQLQLMALDLGANYTLGSNIDMSELTQASGLWNTSTGFIPVGDINTKFSGAFDGLNHTVSGLFINRPSTNYVGLFGYINSGVTVQNVGLVGGSVAGQANVGALAGRNDGTINNSYETGMVSSGGSSGNSQVGGLVGVNQGTINSSYATGDVIGVSYTGGLVGWNQGTISVSYAAGSVTGADNVGGLAGYMSAGTVDNSHATGAVSGANYTGGLVGLMSAGTVKNNSYAEGDVTATGNYVGGLVGQMRGSGTTMTNSYATGNVTGYHDVGGLVGGSGGSISYAHHDSGSVTGTGWNIGGLAGSSSGSIDHSYAVGSGSVTGSGNAYFVGGLVGNKIGGTVSNSYATVNVTGSDTVGGLVGINDGSTLFNNFATGDVNGGNNVGGLVGINAFNGTVSTVTNSYATGAVNGTGDNVGGLVGYNDQGAISDSHATGNVTGANNVGGLVGNNTGSITNSSSGGTVSGNQYVGGLVGMNDGDGGTANISYSYSTSAVTGTGAFSSDIGGLVGHNTGGNSGSATISNSYHGTGTVSGFNCVGGLVGYNGNYGASGGAETITNSYNTGAVTGVGGSHRVGGLVGYNSGYGGAASISNSYSTGAVSGADTGGLVGLNAADGGTATISSSFWDTQTSGQASSSGGTGKTTAEMMQASTFAGWDLATTGGSSAVWRIYEGQTSPLLRSFLTGLTLADTTVTYNGSTQTGAVVTAVGALGGTAASGRNAGAYIAYSNQQGYDITGGTLTINQANLTLSTSNVTKTYDGTTAAAGTAIVAGGALFGADSLSGGTFAFTGKNAGSNKTVTVNGISVNDGNGGNNYSVTYADNTTSAITPKALTLTGSRSYDGTATVNAGIFAIGGLVGTETLALSGSGTVADKNVGAGKTVNVVGLTLGNGGNGGLAGNYTFNGGTQTADITKASLTLSTSNVIKTYDGITNAAGTAIVTNGTLFSGDSLSGGSFAYTDRNAGSNKTVTVSGVTVGDGNGGNNYTVTYASNTASTINKAALTITATASTKTYDGTTSAAAAPTVVGLQTGDTATGLSEVYADKNAGSGKTLTVNGYTVNDGNGGNNYTVTTVANTTGIINKATLTAGLTGTVQKTYDGTTVATLTSGNYNVSGIVSGDTVVLNNPTSGTYDTKNAGTGKTISANGLALSGADAGNYQLAATSASGSVGTIDKAALTITATPNSKTYDGTTTAAAAPTVTGLQTGDTATGLNEIYADKNAGSGKTLTVSGYTVNDGNGGNNYTVTTVAETTGVITPVLSPPSPASAAQDNGGDLTRLVAVVAPDTPLTASNSGELRLIVRPDFIRLPD